jgi:hypothetical protein
MLPEQMVETSRGRTGNEAASRVDRKCRFHDHQRKTWGARGAGPLDPTNRHFWTERALFGRGRLRFRGLVVAPGDAGTRLA